MRKEKTGPKPPEGPTVQRIIQRWAEGTWTLYREQLPTDFGPDGRLVESLRLLGPIRTVTVQSTDPSGLAQQN